MVEFQLHSVPSNSPCRYCGARKPNPPTCSRCGVVRYCCREHQLADHRNHKVACIHVDDCKKDVSKEAERLRDIDWDGDPYGKFWDLEDTRPYMLAQMRLCSALEDIDTSDALNAQLSIQMDLCRLARADTGLRLRTTIPGLMLRLGKDQECYDFLKWWGVTPPDDPCFDDIYLPYLDLKGSDAFEGFGWIFTNGAAELSMVAALTLIKIRILLDLESLDLVLNQTHSTNKRKSIEMPDDSPKAKTARSSACSKPVAKMERDKQNAVEGPTDFRPIDGFTDPNVTEPRSVLAGFIEEIATLSQIRQKKPPNLGAPLQEILAAATAGFGRVMGQSLTPKSTHTGVGNVELWPKEVVEEADENTLLCMSSNIVIANLGAIETQDHVEKMATLEADICELYEVVHKLNSRFWADLVKPREALAAPTTASYIHPGAAVESFDSVKALYNAWYETPGAIEMIRARMEM